MTSKTKKLIILFVFLALFIGAAVWMYRAFVVPQSPYNTELKLRGTE